MSTTRMESTGERAWCLRDAKARFNLRSANRYWFDTVNRSYGGGFRVARTLSRSESVTS